MSMLSAQCDKLRERAKTLRQGRWSDGADDARLMEDAADTIWELRDMAHKERAEADRLRERITTQKQTIQSYRDESREWREVADHAQVENAKLRELVRAAWRCIHTGASCSDCRLIAGGCTLQTAMRELGVEI